MKKYDAIITLSGGVVKVGNNFTPAGYFDSMTFGITGGRYRVIAAAQLAKLQAARLFIFTTGRYRKMQDLYGDDMPTEASIYADYFRLLLAEQGVESPEIICEEKSHTTLTNLIELRKIIIQRKLGKIALLSSDYHLPRSRTLWDFLQGKEKLSVTIDYLSAEDIIAKYLPGVYDQEIAAAYNSPAGRRRQQMEEQGVKALKENNYASQEFQLDPRSK